MKTKTIVFSIISLVLCAMFGLLNFLTSPGFPWAIFPIFGILWVPIAFICYDKKSALLFAVLGSVLIILFFIGVNLITSPGFLWFIFPVFGVLWWPAGVYAYKKKNSMLMAIFGSILLSLFFVCVNFITTPGILWSVIPVILTAWWLLGLYCGKKKKFTLLSIVGSLLIIVSLIWLDYITSPTLEWAIYTILPVLMWPAYMVLKKYTRTLWFYLPLGVVISAYYGILNILVSPVYPWAVFVAFEAALAAAWCYFWVTKKNIWFYLTSLTIVSLALAAVMVLVLKINISWVYAIYFLVVCGHLYSYLGIRKKYVLTAILSSATILLYLIVNNMLFTPGYLWFLYALLPLIWGPVMVIFKEQMKTLWFAVFSVIAAVVYYGGLNLFLFRGFPWAIFPVFALLWWPWGVLYGKTRKHLLMSILATSVSIAFLWGVNMITSAGFPWFLFPSFALVWWPLSMFFFVRKRK